MKIILMLLFLSDFWLSIVNLKKRKSLKKELNKESMLVVCHPKKWLNFSMSKDEKKEIETIFTG